VRPKCILALGKTAVTALIKTNKEIMELRGVWFDWEEIPVMPTYHPSYLLRTRGQPGPVTTARRDLAEVKARIDPMRALQQDPLPSQCPPDPIVEPQDAYPF
jgi:DNA polymerase